MLPTVMKTGRHAIVAYRQVSGGHAFASYIIRNQEGKQVLRVVRLASRNVQYYCYKQQCRSYAIAGRYASIQFLYITRKTARHANITCRQ